MLRAHQYINVLMLSTKLPDAIAMAGTKWYQVSMVILGSEKKRSRKRGKGRSGRRGGTTFARILSSIPHLYMTCERKEGYRIVSYRIPIINPNPTYYHQA